MAKRKNNIDDIDIVDDFELEDTHLIKEIKIKRRIQFLYGQEESVRHFCQLFLFW